MMRKFSYYQELQGTSTNAEQLATEHVEWFLEVIKPLLITHFIHGYKHGKAERELNDESKI